MDAYLTGNLGDEQRKELLAYMDSREMEEVLKQAFMNESDLNEIPNAELIKQSIDKWLDEKMQTKGKVVSFRKWRFAAAAALLFAIAGTTFLIVGRKEKNTLAIVHRYKNDIKAEPNKAVLKLADGKLVELDKAHSGTVADQAGKAVVESNGVISYAGFANDKEVKYNDINTPQSSQIKIQLADGTMVWLDAMSSIHFPTSFPGAKREVEITGQAYFEVAKNPGKPFLVRVNNETVEVLGTHFNVNAYSNEQTIKTTLLEGSVRVIAEGKNVMLKPGEQSDGMNKVTDANIEEVMAWKDGVFRFDGANIHQIMNQVARWYGAEIVYENTIDEEFVAKVKRDVPVSELLSLLENTGQVHFEIEGKKIFVKK